MPLDNYEGIQNTMDALSSKKSLSSKKKRQYIAKVAHFIFDAIDEAGTEEDHQYTVENIVELIWETAYNKGYFEGGGYLMEEFP